MTDEIVARTIEKSNVIKPGDFAIVVATSQHTFAGTVLWIEGNDVMLEKARSLPWWMSHMMLSDMAANGFSDRAWIKLPRAVERMLVVGAVVVMRTSEACREDVTNAEDMSYEGPNIIDRGVIVGFDHNFHSDTFGT